MASFLMLYAAAAFLIALTFALLAYATNREKHYTFVPRRPSPWP
jgi:hypothetical protein